MSSFLNDLQNYIDCVRQSALKSPNSLTCDELFKNEDRYEKEKSLIGMLGLSQTSLKEQGDILEELIKSLLSRIRGIAQVSVTNKKTAIGQVDIQFLIIDDSLYDILGLIDERPKKKAVIGECKNLSKGKSVTLEQIEKACWRSCKSRSLQFFFGTNFTEDARNEISNFNLNKALYFCDSDGVLIIPATIKMIQDVVTEDINFLFFLRWAIDMTRHNMFIVNYF